MKVTPEYQRLLDRRKERAEFRFAKAWHEYEMRRLDLELEAMKQGSSLWEQLRSWWPRKQDKADEPQRRTA